MNWASTGQFIARPGRWHFGVGDRNAVAWLTVAAYALAAVLAFWAFFAGRAGRADRADRAGQRQLDLIDPREASNQRSARRLWLLIAITMVILGVNKQLDLQTLLIQVVRDEAVAGGWYDDRRGYQTEFIVVVAMLGLIATIVLAFALRHVLRRVLLAVLGLGMLVSFVVIRAASFHNVDRVLALGAPIRVNWILEFTGIGLIAISALQWRRNERKRPAAVNAAAVVPARPAETPMSGERIER